MSQRPSTIFRLAANHDIALKRNQVIMKVLKYGLVLPVLKLIKWRYGKYLVTKQADIPVTSYNNNINIYHEAFNKSLEEWTEVRLGKKQDLPQCELLRSANNLCLSIIMEDTAYRDLFNIIMLNMFDGMFEFYKYRKKVYYVYQSGIDGDKAYFDKWDKIKVWTRNGKA